MRTDRLNQLLVTVCVFVVMAMQFNLTTQRQQCRDCGINCECPNCDCDNGPRVQSGPEDLNNPALSEPKYGIFSRLFQRRVPRQQNCPSGVCVVPVNTKPVAQKPAAVNPNCPDGNCPLVNKPVETKSEKPKTGMVRCSCCSRIIVGNDLHTEWTDTNEPISPCCDACWQKMTHEQREKSVENWARKAGLDENTIARYRGAIQ